MKQRPIFVRRGYHRYRSGMTLLIIFILTSLACGIGQSSATFGPPGGVIIASQAESDRLKQNFNQALQEATTEHEAQLRITNQEATSLVTFELTQTGQIPLSEPQIWFTAGRIYMSGKVRAGGLFRLDSLIVATALVDQGRLVVEVQEAQMGSFDFPEALLESITQTVNETLFAILIDLEITRLEILEGEMFVIGKLRE
ncbi:MAG: hypothetical protein AAF485_19935 [Chloroflexota bacterium]